MKIWDDAQGVPLDGKGRPVPVGIFANAALAERWHSAGYNVPAAVDRHQAMLVRCDQQGDDVEAMDAIVDAFFADEARLAATFGIDEHDPDFWRFASAPRYYEFA